MCLRDGVHDGKPETGAAGAPRAGVVGAGEAVEDPVDRVGRDAAAFVADLDQAVAAGEPAGDLNRVPDLGVLDRRRWEQYLCGRDLEGAVNQTCATSGS